jgi:hypothetical protein
MWYAIGPSRLRYERLQFEVRIQHWNAPFLAEAARLMQAIAIDVARGDNQASNRLGCQDGSQARARAENGYAMHRSTLQPGIVIEKAHGTESQTGLLQQFTQDELSTPSSNSRRVSKASDHRVRCTGLA